MKRFSDVVISLVLLAVLSPLMLVISIIIKLDSPGPIFYYRRADGRKVYRLGKNGKPFFYFKFRSMKMGNEEVTKFGYFIRRWHLDELPELFLVLQGKMSLVGPRPLARHTIKRSKKNYLQSLKVKPGITGPFQIDRSDNSVENVIYLNNWYYHNQGFITDLIIILKTPIIIFKRKLGVKKTFLIE